MRCKLQHKNMLTQGCAFVFSVYIRSKGAIHGRLLCLLLTHIQLFVTAWPVAHQAPLSMGVSRQEYWNGLPCPPPGDLSDPGIEPVSLMSAARAGRIFITSATWEAYSQPFNSLNQNLSGSVVKVWLMCIYLLIIMYANGVPWMLALGLPV